MERRLLHPPGSSMGSVTKVVFNAKGQADCQGNDLWAKPPVQQPPNPEVLQVRFAASI